MATIAKLNFRLTSGYVTDGAGETYVLGTDAHPTTRGGVTFGYVDLGGGAPVAGNRSTSYGSRFAGRINYKRDANALRVDLANGAYDLRASMGAVTASATVELIIWDGAESDGIVLANWLNGSSGAAGFGVDFTKVARAFATWDADVAPIRVNVTKGYITITSARPTTNSYLNHLQIDSVIPDLVDPTFLGNLAAVGSVEGEFVASVSGTAVNSDVALLDTYGGRFKVVEVSSNIWEIQTGATAIVAGDPASWTLTTVETLTGSANSPYTTTAPLTVYKRLNPSGTRTLTRAQVKTGISTLAIAAYNRVAVLWDSLWNGLDGVTPDATLTATSSADLVTKWNSLTDRTKTTIIKLDSTQPASSWTGNVSLKGTATAGGDPYYGGAKDFVAGGGGVLIESTDPLNPVLITGEFELVGVRGVHIRDVGFCKKFPGGTGGTSSYSGIITGSTSYKELSVVRLEDVYIGALWADPAAAPADWGVGLMTQFTGQAHEQIDTIRLKFKGCYKGIRGGYTRYWSQRENDYQQVAADLSIVVRADTVFATRNAAWSDEAMFCWEYGNTGRNLLDDSAFAQEHTDFIQHGLGGVNTDIGPTIQAAAFNALHSAKVQYTDSGGIRYFGEVQGFYNDDTAYALESSLIENIVAGSATHQLSLFNGEGFAEYNNASRSGDMPPSATVPIDGFSYGINRRPSLTHSGAGFANTLHYMRGNILGQIVDYFNGSAAITSNTDTTKGVIRNNLFVAWNTTTPGASTPDALLTGPFTQDSENRWIWSFTDTQASQQTFREQLYDKVKPLSGTAGTSDPRTWPTASGGSAPTVITPIADRSNYEGSVISLDVSGNFSGATGYSAVALPTGLSIDTGTGVISGTITAGASASSPFASEVTATNAFGSIADSFIWSVSVAPSPSDTTRNSGLSLSFGLRL